jgi:hypothetical protein
MSNRNATVQKMQVGKAKKKAQGGKVVRSREDTNFKLEWPLIDC